MNKIDYDAIKNIPIFFTKEYVSPEQVVTAGGTITLTHGLGVKPKLVEAVIICKTAEAGYAVGDEVTVEIEATTISYNFSVGRSATTLRCVCGSSGLVAINTSGSVSTLTSANWRLVVRAWA